MPRGTCAVCEERHALRNDGLVRGHGGRPPRTQCPGSARPPLPELMPGVLSQWRESALADLDAEQSWSTHPVAILALLNTIEDRDETLARVRRLADAWGDGWAANAVRVALERP